MIFILHGMDDPDHKYGIEYTDSQLVALEEIKGELEKEDVSNDELDRKVSAASLLFIKHRNFIKQWSALLYFTGMIRYHLGKTRQ